MRLFERKRGGEGESEGGREGGMERGKKKEGKLQAAKHDKVLAFHF